MIFSQQKTRYGTTEEKPKIGTAFKDKKVQAPRPEDLIRYENKDHPSKPDDVVIAEAEKQDKPGDAVYVIQATNYIDGNVVPTIVGAYTEQALMAFLAEKGYTLGSNDLVYPIYRVKRVEVKK